MQKRPAEFPVDSRVVRVVCSDPDQETEKVTRLLQAMREARRRVGENPDSLDPAAFHKFIKNKTKQIKETLHCKGCSSPSPLRDGQG